MRSIAIVLLLLVVQPVLSAQAQHKSSVIHVGVVLDAPSDRNTWILKEFEQQLTGFFVPQYDVRFVPEFTVTADGTVDGIRKGIDKLITNPDVEILLTLGVVSSNEVATRKNLSKPVIAAYVIDAELQGLPMTNGTSGVKNLNYLSVAYSAKRTITLFKDLVPFTKLAILIEPIALEGIPQLGPRVVAEAKSIGVDVVWVPTTNSAQEALRRIPADANAVFVTPLGSLSVQGFNELVQGLIDRKLPSFSYLGRPDVELGILAAYAPAEDATRRARRVAITMQRILNGDNAGTIPVDFSSPSQLTINMATARAIGYYPDWNTLTEAELIKNEESESKRTLSLSSAVKEAVAANLTLKAAQKAVESGREEVNKARAPLLPQLSSSTTATFLRKETAEASLGTQAERQVQGELILRQSIYSDKNWANYSIERHAQEGRESERRVDELDISQQAATAYLNVLRTKALAQIQRSNLKLTISNLELARQRESVGASGKSDVYRWESEAATSRKNVIESDAQVHVAHIAVNRILNRPLEEQFSTQEIALDDPSLITGEKRLFKYFSNPLTFRVYRDFMTKEGISSSPEMKKLDAALAAQERARTSARRSFWLPEVAVQASLKNIFSRSGAGSQGVAFPPSIPISLPNAPDLTWNVGLQVSLPILRGGADAAVLEQTTIEIDKLALQRQSTQQAIEQRVRAALHTGGSSYASIQQARNAAEAARKNLDLVTDAYSRGAASIITLIDAQNAALVASEAAENSVYNFIIDLMNVERAIGTFDFFRSVEEKEAYFQRLDEFYRNAGVHVE